MDKTCLDCIHRRTIPGNCHISCNNHKAKVVGCQTGINGGWFNWPYNFDPTWLDSCDGFSDKEKDNKEDKKLSFVEKMVTLGA